VTARFSWVVILCPVVFVGLH